MAETKRMISPGAESMLGIQIPVLDKGYLTLCEYSGCDSTVVAAARQSYNKGISQEDMQGGERLINFLMREKHTSPFEQPMLVFEMKAPIFVFREHIRHRTAKLNEQSGRYTQLERSFYVPAVDRVQAQSKTNKQGSGDVMDAEFASRFRLDVNEQCNRAFDFYEESVAAGVSKELSRIVLPVNTYSRLVWQMDLSNLLHYLRLRTAPTAQFEIRQYADAMAKIVEQAFPIVWDAFMEYTIKAKTFSASEIATLKKMLDGRSYVSVNEDADRQKIYKKLELV